MAEVARDQENIPDDVPLTQVWARPQPGDPYTVGYEKLARYLLVVEKKHSGFLQKLHHEMWQDNNFTPNDTFLRLTGETLDDGWKRYVEEENVYRKYHDEL